MTVFVVSIEAIFSTLSRCCLYFNKLSRNLNTHTVFIVSYITGEARIVKRILPNGSDSDCVGAQCEKPYELNGAAPCVKRFILQSPHGRLIIALSKDRCAPVAHPDRASAF